MVSFIEKPITVSTAAIKCWSISKENGTTWKSVDYWYARFSTPNDKYYVLKGTKNFYKQEKDRTIFVGEGGNVNMISVQTDNNIPTYYEECTEQEFIAAYEKVKQLLNEVKIWLKS